MQRGVDPMEDQQVFGRRGRLTVFCARKQARMPVARCLRCPSFLRVDAGETTGPAVFCKDEHDTPEGQGPVD